MLGMNTIILQSYQIGIGIGFIILSTLILFPGIDHQRHHNNHDKSTDQDTDTVTNENNANVPTIGLATNLEPKTNVPITEIHQQSLNCDDNPNFISPHRRLNWFIYICIYIVIGFILLHTYGNTTPINENDSISSIPLYRKQLQHPTTLLKLLLDTYLPKEASVLFPKQKARE
jgi:hypothetical protein